MAEPPGAGRRTLRHVPALDGLRGLAVAAVVAYHLGWLSGGFLGVDVFFVLSGYLVTSLVVAEVEGTGRLGLRSFWARRLRRLVPAVLVLVPAVLLGVLLVDWPPTQRGSVVTDGLATLTWWANWRQAAGASYWAPGPSPFRHAWSLSVEEQFYLVWPLIVVVAAVLARRVGWSSRRTIGGVAAAGAAASSVWMVALARATDAADLSRVYLGTDTRILAPLIGCALACWWPDRGGAQASGGARTAVLAGAGHLAAAGLALVMVTVHVPDPELYRQGGFVVVALATAVLMRSVVASSGSVGLLPIFAWRPLCHLGRRSYAIYLWSWPIQVLLQYWRPSWSRVEVTAVVVVASLALAELSHRLVEDPIRRQRGWAQRPALRRPAWALGIGACVVALLVVQDRSLPLPEFERIDTEEAVEIASAPPPTNPIGPADLRVMVAGDSVAFMASYYAPRADLPARIGSIDGRGTIGCGLLFADGWESRDRATGEFSVPGGGDCVDQPAAEAVGLSGRPDVVVEIAGAWEWPDVRTPDGTVLEARSPELADALVAALLVRARAAHDAGAAFAVVEWSCPGTQAAPERRDPAYVRWINGVFARAVEEAQGEGIAAVLIGPTEAICQGGDPTGEPTEAWRAATDDEVHVRNREGGRLLWHQWLAPALVEFLPAP